MPWDEKVWQALKDAITPMPPFVRGKALKTIIEASEKAARDRGSPRVEEQDLVKAAKEKIPSVAKGRMLAALAEYGIKIE